MPIPCNSGNGVLAAAPCPVSLGGLFRTDYASFLLNISNLLIYKEICNHQVAGSSPAAGTSPQAASRVEAVFFWRSRTVPDVRNFNATLSPGARRHAEGAAVRLLDR
ncbi:hypothetical protein ACEQ38_02550 [Ralstonia syzygii subsp. celebesensis]|uniref:hypothetical protein n=1 Tax=Ralstonia syzygii TaxID=28097 RepID=UPI0012FD83B4|nr:hypothetical protein [Ralstonia syzygii]